MNANAQKVALPQELLDALPAAVEAQRNADTTESPLKPFLDQVAMHYGIGSLTGGGSKDRWNAVIDVLERDYPGWRGYTITYPNGRVG